MKTNALPGGIVVINARTGARALWHTGPYVPGAVQYAGDPRNPGHLWMTREGFSYPALGSFGTAPRRFFHGPGLNNWNLALHKDTSIREGMTLQIRAEFFNAFNHAQFANPVGVLANSRFGVIGGLQGQKQRVGQVAAKFIF